ncbi:hypothetical protein BD779DRAFT_1474287 [Infundibulicybe gibba]|nr:hypothetical protein BD779DRAFT_1474287 [Infundibulicybe gibba]
MNTDTLSQNAQLMPPWRASLSVLHVLAIGSTIFRLSQRYTTQWAWYDDHSALFAVIMDGVFFVVLQIWTWGEPNGGSSFHFRYYICQSCLAIARIFPPGRTIRQFAVGMPWSFGLLGIGALFGMAISYGCDTSWHDSPEVQWDLPNALGVATLCGISFRPFALVIPYQRVIGSDSDLRHLFGVYAPPNALTDEIARRAVMFGPRGIFCNNQGLSPLFSVTLCGKDLERSVSEAVSNDMSPLTTVILTNPGSSGGLDQDSYCRGYSFFNSPSLSMKSRTVPHTGGSV